MNETAEPRRRTILVVDDEKLIRWSLKERLEREGYQVREAVDGKTALQHLQHGDIELLLLDFRLPDMDGLEILKVAKGRKPSPAVILMTAYGSIQNAVEAMRHGAYDYIKKPFNLDELVLEVGKAMETVMLRAEVSRYRSRDRAKFRIDNLVGSSPQTEELRRLVKRIAASGAKTILLNGETGTGKGLAARAIHYESEQSQQPFMNITCTALPETLLESELFGHEKGAFTDARNMKKGLLELAHSGTVFLDEVGDMPLSLQGKLLTFLEEKTFRRLGGTRDISVDARIIAATNRDLKKAVEDGSFRADLYYRLNVIPVKIPPLEERRDDIQDLIEHFVNLYNEEFKKSITGFDDQAMEALLSYSWPGNIRELKNALERAILLSESPLLRLDDLPYEIREGASAPEQVEEGGRITPFALPREGINLEDVRKDLLAQALRQSRGNKTGAGKLLGLNRDQVRYWMRKYHLPDPWQLASEEAIGS